MSSGFDNENDIVNQFVLDKSFNDLNENLKKIILKIHKNQVPKIINAKKYGGNNKADLSIIVDNIEYNISVKKGSGNSVHQEPVEDFIAYLRNKIEINESVFDDLRFFIWGDGTTNGKGHITERFSSIEFKKKYPQKVKNIQNYFDLHKFNLINRFLIEGAVSKKQADFLLFGDINKCEIVDKKSVIDFVNKNQKKPLSIGVLTFQAWNRNIEGKIDMENRRGQIQLKWGTLENDLKKMINEQS